MSKTNTEPMQPDTQASESLKLDVTVRPIAPMGNLLAFANVTIGDCFKICPMTAPYSPARLRKFPWDLGSRCRMGLPDMCSPAAAWLSKGWSASCRL